MSFSTIGHIKKRERLARSQEIYDRYEQEEDLETVILKKGNHRGVLHIKETTISWEVYADPQMSQHLDWNHPDCFPQYAEERQQLNPLAFVSMLIEKGWKSI